MARPKRIIDHDELRAQRATDFRGPTAERLLRAGGHIAIGDDKMGTTVHQFLDTPLARLYSRLVRASKRRPDELDTLQGEWMALSRYRNYFAEAGKEVTINSVNANDIHSSNPATRTGMPMSDRQIDFGRKLRDAKNVLGHKCGIVVDNVVCNEHPTEIAGFAIGYTSVFRAREAAEKHLREAGGILAKFWGIG